MIQSTIRIIIPPDQRDEAVEILKSTAAWTSVKPGCLSSRIYQDVQEENTLMFIEIWRSEEYLEYHLRSDDYRKILLVLEMALKQPELRFDTISNSTGIETIEKARRYTR
jgi:quinol monooxygenase YgiN